MSLSPQHAADLEQLKRALGAIQKLRARVNDLESARSEPIAIVGIGCRLPGGAESPNAFWRLLREGIDAVSDAPPDRWDADAFYDPDPEAVGKLPTRRAGFMEQIDQFDPQFFGISPREANGMDPQQRLALETAWEALEDAGIPPDSMAGSSTGVFIGIGLNDYGKLQFPYQQADPALSDAYYTSGNALCITANRLSYALDLRGPSMAIDTACSSSLVAVHTALQSLRKGECTLALVGGTNVMLTPETGIGVSRFLSPDGRCKFGDASANGYVRGEGAAVIVLKPLSRAVADADSIYAVIRGSAVNQDGFSSGLTVPNGVAQQALLRDALADADVKANQIDYVEAHGTGTSLGDPIEVQALGTVLGKGRDGSRPLRIGSVKTNIGHLEAGAGIAGLVKTTLALANEEIPPSLHYQQPNPNIPFESLGIQVQSGVTPWPDGERLAGVSSFGFGGTNAHIILQAAPEVDRPVTVKTSQPQVLLLSAKSEAALNELAGRYAGWIMDHPDTSLPDLCYSAAMGRTHHEFRAAFPAATLEDLSESLESFANGAVGKGVIAGHCTPGIQPRVALLFTGQGSQYPGMGKQLYASNPVFRDALDECAELLAPHLDRTLTDLLFAEKDTPEAALLDQTRYTQPALFALEYALAKLWQSWGIRPAAVAGHSLGEYVAACVAGVFSLEEALTLVAERGRLMGSLPAGGAMAAVFASEACVRAAMDRCDEQVAIAAINGHEHTVVSGAQGAVEEVLARLAADGVRVRRLTVSHAFHSPLMDPILDQFEVLAREVTFAGPAIPFVANLTGRPWTSGSQPAASYWKRHLREPVQFAATFDSLSELGAEVFLEIGPHPVLSGMGRAAMTERTAFVPSFRSGDELQLLKALGQLYTLGIEIDWKAVFSRDSGPRLRLPTYPWQRNRYWFQAGKITPTIQTRTANQLHPLIDRRLRSPSLDDIVYESDISLTTMPFLNDHRAYDTVVVPATALVEMILAAGRDLDGLDYDVAELTIGEALAIADDESRLVQTILKADGENVVVEAVSLGPDDAWQRHLTGLLTPHTFDGSVLDVEAARSTCVEEHDVAVLHDRIASIGMQYGPAFRSLAAVWSCADAAFGQVILQEAAGDASRYILHPALLDACLQVAGTLIPDSEDTVYLPTSFEGISIQRRGQPGNELWCHARKLPTADSATLVCTFEIADSAGEPVATIERATFRRATRSALAAALGRSGTNATPMYEITWREAPLQSHRLPTGEGRWLIFADGDGIARDLASALVERGDHVDLVSMSAEFAVSPPGYLHVEPADPDGFRRLFDTLAGAPAFTGVVYLWGADNQMHDGNIALQGALHLIQALADRDPVRLWLVTRGAQPAGGETTAPDLATIWGLARTTGREHPHLRPVCVDLDPHHDDDSAAFLLEELNADDDEQEVAFRAGTRLVARLTSYRVQQPDQPVRLEIGLGGTIDSLALRPYERQQPGPGEVEIEVRATGLNFRDVLNSLGLYPEPAGNPGSECAGVVTAVGEGVHVWQPGDAVVAMAEGSFGTYILASAELVAPLPQGISFAEAATLPIAFVTAAYSLRHLAGIDAGMRVLIHSATGGVGLAAVQIASAAGAEVFATAGSDSKRDYLRSLGIEHVYDSRSTGFAAAIHDATNGAGVDIVLNSLTGDLIPESLAALHDGGCFLEIGKRGIWTSEEVEALGRGIDYHPIYVGGVTESDPGLIGDILRGICNDVTAGALTPLPLRSLPLHRAEDAFRLMSQTRHIGKIVVTNQESMPSGRPPHIREDATYLVTGGTGGIGLEVAGWLVEQGARSLVLVGRSAPSEHALGAITTLEQSGARVTTYQADISDRAEVARMIESINRSKPPLAGVIHAAGMLDDGVIVQQDWGRFERVLGPKLAGAWNLHHLTAGMKLDFFVLFSAGAALVGAPGQANYVAANAALDSLAHWRRSRGLPTVSINWGPWADVGMAAGLDNEHRQRIEAGGFRSLSTEEGLRGLEAAMSSGHAQIAVMPADWDAFARGFAQTSPPALFRDLIKGSTVSASQALQPDSNMAQQLALIPASLRRGAVMRFVREQAAQVLGLTNPADIPTERPLNELGLDSLMAVDLRNQLARSLNLSLSTTLLFDYPSADSLTDYLLTRLPDEAASETITAQVTSRNGADVANLSDDEAEALLLAELSER